MVKELKRLLSAFLAVTMLSTVITGITPINLIDTPVSAEETNRYANYFQDEYLAKRWSYTNGTPDDSKVKLSIEPVGLYRPAAPGEPAVYPNGNITSDNDMFVKNEDSGMFEYAEAIIPNFATHTVATNATIDKQRMDPIQPNQLKAGDTIFIGVRMEDSHNYPYFNTATATDNFIYDISLAFAYDQNVLEIPGNIQEVYSPETEALKNEYLALKEQLETDAGNGMNEDGSLYIDDIYAGYYDDDGNYSGGLNEWFTNHGFDSCADGAEEPSFPSDGMKASGITDETQFASLTPLFIKSTTTANSGKWPVSYRQNLSYIWNNEGSYSEDAYGKKIAVDNKAVIQVTTNLENITHNNNAKRRFGQDNTLQKVQYILVLPFKIKEGVNVKDLYDKQVLQFMLDPFAFCINYTGSKSGKFEALPATTKNSKFLYWEYADNNDQTAITNPDAGLEPDMSKYFQFMGDINLFPKAEETNATTTLTTDKDVTIAPSVTADSTDATAKSSVYTLEASKEYTLTAPDAPDGKKFAGWSAATTRPADDSSLIASTDTGYTQNAINRTISFTTASTDATRSLWPVYVDKTDATAKGKINTTADPESTEITYEREQGRQVHVTVTENDYPLNYDANDDSKKSPVSVTIDGTKTPVAAGTDTYSVTQEAAGTQKIVFTEAYMKSLPVDKTITFTFDCGDSTPTFTVKTVDASTYIYQAEIITDPTNLNPTYGDNLSLNGLVFKVSEGQKSDPDRTVSYYKYDNGWSTAANQSVDGKTGITFAGDPTAASTNGAKLYFTKSGTDTELTDLTKVMTVTGDDGVQLKITPIVKNQDGKTEIDPGTLTLFSAGSTYAQYTVISDTTSPYDVDPKEITVTPSASGVSKTYDGSNTLGAANVAKITYTPVGLVNGDNAAAVPVTALNETAPTFAGVHAGTQNITIPAANTYTTTNSNYAITGLTADYTAPTGTIGAKTVTVAFNSSFNPSLTAGTITKDSTFAINDSEITVTGIIADDGSGAQVVGTAAGNAKVYSLVENTTHNALTAAGALGQGTYAAKAEFKLTFTDNAFANDYTLNPSTIYKDGVALAGRSVKNLTAEAANVTKYIHGETLPKGYAGNTITVTWNDDSTTKYTYNDTTGNWDYTAAGSTVNIPFADSGLTVYYQPSGTGVDTTEVAADGTKTAAYQDNKKYTLKVGNGDRSKAASLTNDVPVNKRPITVTIAAADGKTAPDDFTKEYDGNANYTVKANIKATIGGTGDANSGLLGTDSDVAVNMNSLSFVYANASGVTGIDAEDAGNKTISTSTTAANVGLTGTNAGCYEVTDISGSIDGKINPKELDLSGETLTIPSAQRNPSATADLKLTSEEHSISGGASGETVKYTFDATYPKNDIVNGTATPNVTLSNATICDPEAGDNYKKANYELINLPTPKQGSISGDAPGTVQSLAIEGLPNTATYGDMLDITNMVIKEVVVNDDATGNDTNLYKYGKFNAAGAADASADEGWYMQAKSTGNWTKLAAAPFTPVLKNGSDVYSADITQNPSSLVKDAKAKVEIIKQGKTGQSQEITGQAKSITLNMEFTGVEKTYNKDTDLDKVSALKDKTTFKQDNTTPLTPSNDNKVTLTGATIGGTTENITVDLTAITATTSKVNVTDTENNIKVSANNAYSGVVDFDKKYAITLAPTGTATINAREITLESITNIKSIQQYTTTVTGSYTAVNGGATGKATAAYSWTGTGDAVVSGDTVEVTFNYDYETSNEAKTRDDVKVSNIALASGVTNYTLIGDKPKTGSGEVTGVGVNSVTLNLADTDYTYDTKDTLNLVGATVTVAYDGGTSATYTAVADGTGIKWQTGGTDVTAPFTMNKAHGDTLTTGSNTITATISSKTGSADVTVKQKEISKIKVTGDTIVKDYNGNTTADKTGLTFEALGIKAGDTVEVTGNVAFPDSNANAGSDGNIISGKSEYDMTINNHAFVSGTNDNANYKFADTVTFVAENGTDAHEIKGKIKRIPVTIASITGIPSVDLGDGAKKTGGAATTDATNASITSKITLADGSSLVGSENIEVSYSYQYTDASVAGTGKAVKITDITPTNTTVSDNYEVSPTELDGTGTINGATATDANTTVVIDSQDYTHGDKLDLTGLKVTIGDKEYEIGTQAWKNIGFKVYLGNDEVTVKAPTDGKYLTDTIVRFDGSYTGTENNSKKPVNIKVTIPTAIGQMPTPGVSMFADTTVEKTVTNQTVKRAQLGADAALKTGVTEVKKNYDGDAKADKSNTAIVLNPTGKTVQNDEVALSAPAYYMDGANTHKDVKSGLNIAFCKTAGETVSKSGTHADCYIVPDAADINAAALDGTGKIEQRPITITATIPDIYVGDDDTVVFGQGTGENTEYTYGDDTVFDTDKANYSFTATLTSTTAAASTVVTWSSAKTVDTDNYLFTYTPLSYIVKANAITNIEAVGVVTSSIVHGETLPDGVNSAKIKVTRTNGKTTVYTYNGTTSAWDIVTGEGAGTDTTTALTGVTVSYVSGAAAANAGDRADYSVTDHLYNFTVSDGTHSASPAAVSVYQRPVNIRLDVNSEVTNGSKSREYNGNANYDNTNNYVIGTVIPVPNNNASGLVAGEINATVTGLTGLVYVNKDGSANPENAGAANSKNITLSNGAAGITLTGSKANCYTVNEVSALTDATIEKKKLTAIAADLGTISTAKNTNQSGNLTVALNRTKSDTNPTATVPFTFNATFKEADVRKGTPCKVAISDYAVTGAYATNYTITGPAEADGTFAGKAPGSLEAYTVVAPTEANEYGDMLNLKGLTVTEQVIGNDGTSLTDGKIYKYEDNKWQVNSIENPGTFTEIATLPFTLSLVKGGTSTNANVLTENLDMGDNGANVKAASDGAEGTSAGTITVNRKKITLTINYPTGDTIPDAMQKTYNKSTVFKTVNNITGVTFTQDGVSGDLAISGSTVTAKGANGANVSVKSDGITANTVNTNAGDSELAAETISGNNTDNLFANDADKNNYELIIKHNEAKVKINPMKINVNLAGNPTGTVSQAPITGTETASNEASKTGKNKISVSAATAGETVPSETIEVTYKYTFATGNVAGNQTLSFSDLALTTTNNSSTNYEIANTWNDVTSAVEQGDVNDVEVKKTVVDYYHGEKLDLSDLSVTLKNYEEIDGAQTDVTYSYDTDADSNWVKNQTSVELVGGTLTNGMTLNYNAGYVTNGKATLKVIVKPKVNQVSLLSVDMFAADTVKTIDLNIHPIPLSVTAQKSVDSIDREYDTTTTADKTNITLPMAVDETKLIESVKNDAARVAAIKGVLTSESGDNKISVSADANYATTATTDKQSNALAAGADNYDIMFDNIALGGANSTCYVKPDSIASLVKGGRINPRPVYIEVTQLPVVYGGDPTKKELAVNDNYTIRYGTKDIPAGGKGAFLNGENTSLTVYANYADTTLAEGESSKDVDMTYTGEWAAGTADAVKGNYSVTYGGPAKGTVRDDKVESLDITATPTNLEKHHGDPTEYRGITINVVSHYSKGNRTVTEHYTYKTTADDGVTQQGWYAAEVNEGVEGEAKYVASPPFLTRWHTSNSATVEEAKAMTAVGTYFNRGGSDTGHYMFVVPADSTLIKDGSYAYVANYTIKQKEVSVNITGGAEKVYDGDANVEDPMTTNTLAAAVPASEVVSGETVNVSGINYVFTNADRSEEKSTVADAANVKVNGNITLSNDNYVVKTTDGITYGDGVTGKITAKPVNITLNGSANKLYDGDSAVTDESGITAAITGNVGTNDVDIDKDNMSFVFATSGSIATANAGGTNAAAKVNVVGGKDGIKLNNANYSVGTAVNNITGTINKFKLTLNSITDIPNATVGVTSSQTGNDVAATTDTDATGSHAAIVSGETGKDIPDTGAITITYDYSYDSILAAKANQSVTISDTKLTGAWADNYTLSELTDATGKVEAGEAVATDAKIDKANYIHGDKIELNSLSVKINGTEYKYTDAQWNDNNITVELAGQNGNTDTTGITNDTVLRYDGTYTHSESGNQKQITLNVVVPKTLNAAKISTFAESEPTKLPVTLYISKAPLTAAAKLPDSVTTLTREYNATSDADGITYELTGFPAFVKADDEGAVEFTADAFYKNHDTSAEQINWKSGLDISFKNKALNDKVEGGTVAGCYTVTGPDDLVGKGEITKRKLTVNVTELPAVYIGDDKVQTLTATNSKYKITDKDNTEITEDKAFYSDKTTDRNNYTFKAEYANTDTPGEKDVTYSVEGPASSEIQNYDITIGGAKGNVSAYQILSVVVNDPYTDNLTHGDTLPQGPAVAAGTTAPSIVVTWDKAEEPKTTTYTYDSNSKKWSRVDGGANVSFAESGLKMSYSDGTDNNIAADGTVQAVYGTDKQYKLNVNYKLKDAAEQTSQTITTYNMLQKEVYLKLTDSAAAVNGKQYDGDANFKWAADKTAQMTAFNPQIVKSSTDASDGILTVNGTKDDVTVSDMTLTYISTDAAVAAKDVGAKKLKVTETDGVYSVTLGGAQSGCYKVIGVSDVISEITQKVLTVTELTAAGQKKNQTQSGDLTVQTTAKVASGVDEEGDISFNFTVIYPEQAIKDGYFDGDSTKTTKDLDLQAVYGTTDPKAKYEIIVPEGSSYDPKNYKLTIPEKAEGSISEYDVDHFEITMPDKTTYEYGDVLNKVGMTVTAHLAPVGSVTPDPIKYKYIKDDTHTEGWYIVDSDDNPTGAAVTPDFKIEVVKGSNSKADTSKLVMADNESKLKVSEKKEGGKSAETTDTIKVTRKALYLSVAYPEGLNKEYDATNVFNTLNNITGTAYNQVDKAVGGTPIVAPPPTPDTNGKLPMNGASISDTPETVNVDLSKFTAIMDGVDVPDAGEERKIVNTAILKADGTPADNNDSALSEEDAKKYTLTVITAEKVITLNPHKITVAELNADSAEKNPLADKDLTVETKAKVNSGVEKNNVDISYKFTVDYPQQAIIDGYFDGNAESKSKALDLKAVYGTTDPKAKYEIETPANGSYKPKNYTLQLPETATGTISDNKATSIKVTGQPKTNWTHGDAFELTGLKLEVGYKNNSKETYERKADGWYIGSAKAATVPFTTQWSDDKATKTYFPYPENGKYIVVTLKDDPTKSANVGPYRIAKKPIKVTVTGTAEKPYDATTTVINPSLITAALDTSAIVPGETVNIARMVYSYTSANAADPAAVSATATLGGTDAGSYQPTYTNNIKGKITPIRINILTITDIPNAEVSQTNAKGNDVQATNKASAAGSHFTAEPVVAAEPIPASDTVTITYDYEYTSNLDAGKENVKISDVKLNGISNVNYIINEVKIGDNNPGTVDPGHTDNDHIEVDKIQKDYIHGDTLDLADLTAKINGIEYKYSTDADSAWVKNNIQVSIEDNDNTELSGKTLRYDGAYAKGADGTVKTINLNVVIDSDVLSVPAPSTAASLFSALPTRTVTLTIRQKPLTAAAEKTVESIDKEYDGTTTADKSKITFVPAGLVGDDKVILTADADYESQHALETAQAIKFTNIAMSGDNANCYIKPDAIAQLDAAGKITKRNVVITPTLPEIYTGAENKQPITSYTAAHKDGAEGDAAFIGSDESAYKFYATYEDTSVAGETPVTYSYESENTDYEITFNGPDKGTVKSAENKITSIKVEGETDTDVTHGDPTNLDGITVKVTYEDGTVDEYIYKEADPENNVDGGWYKGDEKPESLPFVSTWDDEDKTPLGEFFTYDKNGKEIAIIPTIEITGGDNGGKIGPFTVHPKTIKVTLAGSTEKVYDGKSNVTDWSKITASFEGVMPGDMVDIDKDKSALVFANSKNENAETVNAAEADSVKGTIELNNAAYIADPVFSVDAKITPKTMNISLIKVSSVKKGSDGKVNKTESSSFETTDIIGEDKVTIAYSGQYSSTAKAGTDIPVTIDTATLKIDGDEKAVTNYVIGKLDKALGTVTEETTNGNSSGPRNSLTIKYELEDGTPGDAVSKLSATAGSDKVDLIAVLRSQVSNPVYVWTSSDEKVVTVDENGVLTFVSEGKATVTAQLKNNDLLKDSVEITVTPAKPNNDNTLVNKTVLNPYIVGYEDGSFGPERPITRQEIAAIITRLLTNTIETEHDYPTRFSDVTPDMWGKNSIAYLEQDEFKILSGYEDGTFRPYNAITRAEMAVVIAKAEKYDLSAYENSKTKFSDINPEDSWALPAIKCLSDAGVLTGYKDGTFRPGQPITRAETVTMINNILDKMEVEEVLVRPTDVTSAHWAYDNIILAMNHRVLMAVADSNSPETIKETAEPKSDEASSTAEPETTANPKTTAKPKATAEPKKTAVPKATATPKTSRK